MERPACAKQLCLILQTHKVAPRAVPNVLVMRSVTPESRVGRNAAATSIVRLTEESQHNVSRVARLIFPTAEKYA